MHGIVAAGAIAPVELRERGIERIPLLKISGETLLERACRCLIEGGGCESVYVLAPPDVPLPARPEVVRVDYSGDLAEDVMHCVRVHATSEYILLAGADMPLITSEAIAALRRTGHETGADWVYPVVERTVVEERFPGTKRTYLRAGKLTFTGGNVFWLNRERMLQCGGMLRQMVAERKSVVGLARLFGLWFLVKVALGFADLRYIERHLGRILNGKLCAAIMPYPELAVDLDKAADLDLFLPHLDPW